jgi:hypothetical protein
MEINDPSPKANPKTGVCILEMTEKRAGVDAGVIWGQKDIAS